MKKIAFMLLMLGSILQVKAQQSLLLPGQKSPLQLYTYKLKPDTGVSKLFKGNPDSFGAIKITPGMSSATMAAVNIDRMPIARLNNNDLKMPIVQTDRTGYTMPVVGMNLPEVYNMKKPGAGIGQLP